MRNGLKKRIAKLENREQKQKSNTVIFYDPSARTTEAGSTIIEVEQLVGELRNNKDGVAWGRYMLAPNYPDTESWERALLQQQRDLLTKF